MLTVYGPWSWLAATEISALHALTLAGDLVTAARRRVGVIEALRWIWGRVFAGDVPMRFTISAWH